MELFLLFKNKKIDIHSTMNMLVEYYIIFVVKLWEWKLKNILNTNMIHFI